MSINPTRLKQAQYISLVPNYGLSYRQVSPAVSPSRKPRQKSHGLNQFDSSNVYINDFLHPNPSGIPMRLVREFIASFTLLLFACMSAKRNDQHWIAAALGLAHFVNCEAFYGTSGNPWIVLVNQLIFHPYQPRWYLGVAWTVQFAGAMSATALANQLVPDLWVVLNQPQVTTSLGYVFLAEALFSSLYAYVHTTCYRTSAAGEAPVVITSHGSLLLSVVYYAALVIPCDTTGTSLNLWRSLAPAVITNSYTNNLWMYGVGSFVGYVSAALIAGYLHINQADLSKD